MKITIHFFASDQSFLDPLTSSDGTPYRQKRYKELVKECWYISDQLHTSYTDVLDIAISDRLLLIKLINEKIQATNKAMEEAKANRNQK